MKRIQRALPCCLAPLLAALLLAACVTEPVVSPTPRPAPTQSGPAPSASAPVASSQPAAAPVPPEASAPAAPAPAAAFREAQWADLPEWQRDEMAQAWGGFLASCRAIREATMRAAWADTCEAARALGDKPTTAQVRSFIESRLSPWQVVNADGSVEGLVTGYYEPLIRGSRWKSDRFATPIHSIPDDMLQLDMGGVYPELKNMRLRGRIEGRKVLPYWNRAQLLELGERLPARVLFWAEDPIEFFFLQVQGSGQVQLSDNTRVRVAYADQNGHPYVSIGRWLVQQGELKLEQASMQGIKNWARANPRRLDEMLNANPSYVFFREEASNGEGPKGSLGVPLAAERAIAIDPRSIPLGAPVFLSFPRPDGGQLNRLVMAQDTGGAIRGRVRADFYWGFGAEAGAMAGKMRQQGRMWLLWPRGAVLPAAQ